MKHAPATNLFEHLEPRLAELLQSLNAHGVPHSKRTLAEHLVGTYDLLRAWGNGEAVCRAGLFHSIYGTRVFEIQCADFSSRKMVREVIGAGAESLAYLFCIADRNSFFSAAQKKPHVICNAAGKTTLQVSRQELASLLEIEAANIVEHIPRRGKQTRRDMKWYRGAFADCSEFLSAAGARTIADVLDTYTIDESLRAIH